MWSEDISPAATESPLKVTRHVVPRIAHHNTVARHFHQPTLLSVVPRLPRTPISICVLTRQSLRQPICKIYLKSTTPMGLPADCCQYTPWVPLAACQELLLVPPAAPCWLCNPHCLARAGAAWVRTYWPTGSTHATISQPHRFLIRAAHIFISLHHLLACCTWHPHLRPCHKCPWPQFSVDS
jgi:hypothetical protein